MCTIGSARAEQLTDLILMSAAVLSLQRSSHNQDGFDGPQTPVIMVLFDKVGREAIQLLMCSNTDFFFSIYVT